MAEFYELIRKFDKIRDYMRDFYIYGFKSRDDFTQKSSRTYDNEKRRIESYMGEYMKWVYTKNGKTSFISMDCARISENPLYAAWKSKSFTANDIMLHFYLLDVLRDGTPRTIEELTNMVSEESSVTFDAQIVRIKCAEYVKNGLLLAEKRGKAMVYCLSSQNFDHLAAPAPRLLDAVRFFQGAAPFGEIGSYLLDNEGEENELFVYKHNYVAHTLENGVLWELLTTMRKGCEVSFVTQSERRGTAATIYGVPLKIFASAATGRRYLCLYLPGPRRFMTFRLDHIKSVAAGEPCRYIEELREKLTNHTGYVWGVGFGGRSRLEILCMKLWVDEQTEGYILERVMREGQGGELLKLAENTYLYTKELYDSNDISPWLKTFTGRILQLEGSNREVVDRFYRDVDRLREMYAVVEQAENAAGGAD